MQDGTKLNSGRGRPRGFDKDDALTAAQSVFQEKGYTGASLDELAKAMGIKRSSLNNTFGNKQALYIQTLTFYAENLGKRLSPYLFSDKEITVSFKNYFSELLEVYCEENGKGCFFSTSLPDVARLDDTFRTLFTQNLTVIESMFYKRLEASSHTEDDSNHLTAQLLAGLQHTLSLRARSGVNKAELQLLCEKALLKILSPV